MDKEYAEYLLKKLKEDYNLIAEEFSATRNYLPKDFKNWLIQYFFAPLEKNSLTGFAGEKVLDWGCGNGRFYEVFKNGDYYGVDISEKMIELARARYPKGRFQVVEPLSLPFPDNFFDKIFSLAVFHHLPSEEFRLQFLKEAKRILKSEGILILTVWDLNPLKILLTGEWKRAWFFFKYLILKLFGRSRLDFKDFFLPWGKICQRYLHYFTKNELRKLAERTGFKIKEIGILRNKKEANIYLIAQNLPL